ncbi:MAG: YciI family protein [Actinomycetota bacterium]
MRFLVMVMGDEGTESGKLPTTEELAEMGNYNEELVKAGVMLTGEGLHPSSKGVRIDYSGEKPVVIDGPFAEAKELVAGFWMIQTQSLEEAVDWLSRAPFRSGHVEIRQVFEDAEFGDALTPELRAQSERHRTQGAKNA